MVKIGQTEGSNHLAEVRCILEPEMAALAAQRIQESELATMREAVSVMDRSQQDPQAYIEADLDFHLALAEGAGNPLILSLLDSIVALLREQRLRIFRVPGEPQRGQIHHKKILEGVERHDPEKARGAMRAHLLQVRQDSDAPAAPAETWLSCQPPGWERQNRMARVGFIGLGVMGSQVVSRLLDKGHEVTGHNRTRAKAEWLIQKGMRWADSPRAVAGASEYVFAMVTNGGAIQSISECRTACWQDSGQARFSSI